MAFTPVITITLALVVGLLTLVSPSRTSMSYVAHSAHLALGLSALVILYMEGVTDDLIGVGYKAKFLTQLICAVMIICTGLWLNNLHGLFGVYELSPWVGMPLTAVLLVFIINAVNLIDGIDGLASGLSMIALFFLGCLYGFAATGPMPSSRLPRSAPSCPSSSTTCSGAPRWGVKSLWAIAAARPSV